MKRICTFTFWGYQGKFYDEIFSLHPFKVSAWTLNWKLEKCLISYQLPLLDRQGAVPGVGYSKDCAKAAWLFWPWGLTQEPGRDLLLLICKHRTRGQRRTEKPHSVLAELVDSSQSQTAQHDSLVKLLGAGKGHSAALYNRDFCSALAQRKDNLCLTPCSPRAHDNQKTSLCAQVIQILRSSLQGMRMRD